MRPARDLKPRPPSRRRVVTVTWDWAELGRRVNVACELFWAVVVTAAIVLLLLALVAMRLGWAKEEVTR